jgi:hypothetical protein
MSLTSKTTVVLNDDGLQREVVPTIDCTTVSVRQISGFSSRFVVNDISLPGGTKVMPPRSNYVFTNPNVFAAGVAIGSLKLVDSDATGAGNDWLATATFVIEQTSHV